VLVDGGEFLSSIPLMLGSTLELYQEMHHSKDVVMYSSIGFLCLEQQVWYCLRVLKT
jgi:hypothetical protein